MSKQLSYYYRNKELIAIRSIQYRKNRRLKVLKAYSNGEIKCACCGEKEYEFLSIDHIDGGGRKHRAEIGPNIDRWLIKNNFPQGFRVLCQNCNFSIGVYKYCPHEKTTEK